MSISPDETEESVKPATETPQPKASPAVGSYMPPHSKSNNGGSGSLRVRMAILGATLLTGVLGGAWLMKSYGPQPVAAAAVGAAGETGPANIVVDPTYATGSVAANAPTGVTPSAEIVYNRERIVELERRLANIDVQAQAAGGNASRAEGLMVAFAARRAIERGLALGYIENELNQRFGATMPRAVSTIIDASKQPMTADKLSEQLEKLSPQLLSDGTDEGFWANAQREIGQLFIVREDDDNYLSPDQRLSRARRALDIGRVDRAIAEVEKMPGAAKAHDWLVVAKRFNEAQRALDLIEYAAIQGPRAATIQQQSLNQQGLGAAVATAPVETNSSTAAGTAATVSAQ